MANYTPNFNLIKPEQEDFYNVDDFNANMDTLDEEVAQNTSARHTHSNKSALDTIPSGGVVITIGNDNTTVPTSKAVNDAINGSGAVRGDISQAEQTDVWRAQARDNIGLGFFSVVNGALCITYEEA